MRRVTQSVLVLVMLSVWAAAQAPAPTAKLPSPSEPDKNEVFGGFVYEPTDWGPAWQTYYGFDVNYTRSLSKRFGAVADFDYYRNNDSLAGDLDHGQAHNSSAYGYRFGPRVNFVKNRRFQPYGVFLLGGAHFTTLFPYPTHTSPLVQHDWSGFSWGGGVGLDARLTKHVGARAEWFHERLPWGDASSTSDWERFSFGATFRF